MSFYNQIDENFAWLKSRRPVGTITNFMALKALVIMREAKCLVPSNVRVGLHIDGSVPYIIVRITNRASLHVRTVFIFSEDKVEINYYYANSLDLESPKWALCAEETYNNSHPITNRVVIESTEWSTSII
jgi:hypothetical protein